MEGVMRVMVMMRKKKVIGTGNAFISQSDAGSSQLQGKQHPVTQSSLAASKSLTYLLYIDTKTTLTS